MDIASTVRQQNKALNYSELNSFVRKVLTIIQFKL